MLTLPDRLADIASAIEMGQAVDYGKVSLLQAIDLARLGRQAVEEAVQRQEEADEQWRQLAESR